MKAKEEIALALAETIRNYPGVKLLSGDSSSCYFYLVPERLASEAGSSASHFENDICFWICLDSGTHKIRLAAGRNPRKHSPLNLVYAPGYWDTTILDEGEKADWKENIRVQNEVRWIDIANEKDPNKRKALIDGAMSKVETRLLHQLKFVSIK